MADEVVLNDVYDKDAPFLPDGWDGKTDIFTDDGQLNDEAFIRDGGVEEVAEATPENVDSKTDEAYLTEVAQQSETVEHADEEGSTKPDGAKTDAPPSRVLKLKVNHEEQTIDIGAMTDDELIALLQKGKAFDAMKDDQAKATYRKVYQDQLDAGMTEELAQFAAERKAGKAYSLTDEEPEEKPAEAEPEVTKKDVRTFQREVEQLKALYPDFKEMPQEVMNNVYLGIPLINAYQAYRDKQSQLTAATLKKENEVLKQNAAAAAKAPVRSATGGGDSTPKRTDYFVKGWNDDPW